MGLFLSWVHICVGGWRGRSSIGGMLGVGGCVRSSCWVGIINCGNNVLGGRWV
jgi:hypothetical protein